MATVRNFEELRIWQEARQLVRETYKMTSTQPFENDYGLRNQMNQSLQLSKEIAAFISYLKRSPIKGHKYNNLKLGT